MIFSELYSAYYNAVAKILTKAMEPGVTEKDLQKCVGEHAFSESIMTILPALKSERWQLLHDDLTPVVYEAPTMPLTLLQKRWLKSLMDDPRIRLFDVALPDLDNVEPLFTGNDYKVYDQYKDGDPFASEEYILKFRILRQAVREKRPVVIKLRNRLGNLVKMRCYPVGFEYSWKDDKLRVLAEGCKFKYFNLGRVVHCDFYAGEEPWKETPSEDVIRELVIEITDDRNALERMMLHFAHLEKRVERLEGNRYCLYLKYYASDETEMVIRILSFGPCIKVIGPENFVEVIKKRLILQKDCEL